MLIENDVGGFDVEDQPRQDAIPRAQNAASLQIRDRARIGFLGFGFWPGWYVISMYIELVPAGATAFEKFIGNPTREKMN